MSQPPGFVDPAKEHFFCRLDKAIYGLHQSGRVWFFEIDRVLSEIGFVKFSHCNCVYTFKSEIILLLYVDDMVLFARSKNVMSKALGLLQKYFDIKVLGRTKRLLGVEFEECDRELCIHQKSYISEICDRFQSFNFPISSLPIAKGTYIFEV